MNHSPENIKANRFTMQGDVWNLGLLVYEMIIRKKLFNEKDKNLKANIINFNIEKIKFDLSVNLFA